MTCGERLLRSRARDKFGRTLTIGRTAVLTQPLNGTRGVPLLRSLRTGLRYRFLLQQSRHHGGPTPCGAATARFSPTPSSATWIWIRPATEPGESPTSTVTGAGPTKCGAGP